MKKIFLLSFIFIYSYSTAQQCFENKVENQFFIISDDNLNYYGYSQGHGGFFGKSVDQKKEIYTMEGWKNSYKILGDTLHLYGKATVNIRIGKMIKRECTENELLIFNNLPFPAE